MIAPNHPTRIVILGAGFGGMYIARRLEKLVRDHANVEITLVSRHNYFLMTPLLFEAGSGVLEPRHSVHPIRRLLSTARFVEAEIQSMDVERKVVLARPSPDEIYEIPYDHLVLALGGVTNRAIIPGAADALTFKNLADAIFLRNHVIELFERADVEQDPLRKKAMLTFVVVGAGLVGVELMGELTEFTRNLSRSYPRVKWEELRFELLEAGPHVMPEMDRDMADYAVNVLRQRGVVVRVNSPAKGIEIDRVHLAGDETIRSETIILAVGVAASPLLKDLPIAKDRKGRAAVDATMRSTSHSNIWALGDCASIPDPQGKPYPQLAQHALREARVLAQNIVSALHNRPLRPFVYRSLGTLAALGHYKGVGRVMRLRFKGFIAWWIWRTYYLLQMPRWDRRLRIVLDWTVALLFKNDIVKLDLFGKEHPWRRDELKQLAKAQVEREIIGGEYVQPGEWKIVRGEPGSGDSEVHRKVGTLRGEQSRSADNAGNAAGDLPARPATP